MINALYRLRGFAFATAVVLFALPATAQSPKSAALAAELAKQEQIRNTLNHKIAQVTNDQAIPKSSTVQIIDPAEVEAALKANPDDVNAYHWLLTYHRWNGDYQRDLQVLQEVTTRWPVFWPARMAHGDLLREQGDRGGELPRILHSEGYVAQRQGDLETAERFFYESLVIFVKIGNQRGIAESLAGIAGVWGERGELRRAAVLLSAALHMLEAVGAQWWPADRYEYQRNLAMIQSALREDEFTAAWEEGQPLTAEAAIEYATPG